MSDFYLDLKRFGPDVAMMRDEHRRRVQEFRSRQIQLVIIGGFHLIVTPLHTLPAMTLVIGLLLFQVATTEAIRMRRFGRYWRTNRSEGLA